jgi:hypothetical protein
MKKIVLVFLVCLFSFFMFSTSASAIAITNYSFEDPGLGDSGWVAGASGWSVSGSAGVWNPTDASYLSIPDGDNVAWVNEGYLFQNINNSLIENNLYTLQVAVGMRVGEDFWEAHGPWPGYSVGLWDMSGNLLASEGFLTPDQGEFLTSTVTYLATAGTAGQYFQIRLYGDGIQVNFDNVRLENQVSQSNDLAPIPEPSTLILIGAGLLGLALVRRK